MANFVCQLQMAKKNRKKNMKKTKKKNMKTKMNAF